MKTRFFNFTSVVIISMLVSQSNNQLTMFLDKYQGFWYILYYTFKVVATFCCFFEIDYYF